jgi:hypothetical protein
MKKKLFLVLTALVSQFAVVTITSCNEDETPKDGNELPTNSTLSVDKPTIDANAEGGNYPIAITTDTTWTTASSADWCTVAPTSGKGSGTLTVTVAKNSGDARTATVTITAVGKAEVKVTQAAGDNDDGNKTDDPANVALFTPDANLTSAEIVALIE